MEFGLKGKRALVLGASRGLGAATAIALAGEGAVVYAAARHAPALATTGSMRPMTVDLADRRSVDQLVADVSADGGIDVLVNNSGGPKAGPALGQPAAAWQAAFEAMALSIFAITDALLPGMIERSWGRVITIGSSGIEQPIAGLALSNGVRAAIAGWSKTLAAEVARHGVTVNMILPGRIDTDRVRELDTMRAGASGDVAAVRAASEKSIPAGRYGRPEEFAAMIAFLASDQASYVTGSTIRVDGGLIAAR